MGMSISKKRMFRWHIIKKNIQSKYIYIYFFSSSSYIFFFFLIFFLLFFVCIYLYIFISSWCFHFSFIFFSYNVILDILYLTTVALNHIFPLMCKIGIYWIWYGISFDEFQWKSISMYVEINENFQLWELGK